MMSLNTQRGSIVIYTLVAMTAILAIGVSLSGLFIEKLKRSRAAQDSSIAIYVADSAAEKCLFEAFHPGNPQALNFSNGATYTIFGGSGYLLDVTGDCSLVATSTLQFRVVGTYRNVSRALEIIQ